MTDVVLLVDDDVRVVSALQRMLYRHYTVEIAAGPQDALAALAENSYAVVVSDLQMPEMNGVELLTKVRELSPDTVRVLLTGNADLDMAIAAVNEGNIFRFLTKPCPQLLLRTTLDAALEQHRLQVAEKEVLEETLTGTVAILVEILAAIQPLAFGRASRIRRYMLALAGRLRLTPSWEFEAAAMLSQIGCISVDPRILQRHYGGENLEEADRRHLLSQASVGRKLLHLVPRLQGVSQMIERQYQPWTHLETSQDEPNQIATGAQMLKVVTEFDRLVGAGRTVAEAISALQHEADEYQPAMIVALNGMQDELAGADAGTDATRAVDSSTNEQLIYRPIAEEVMRSLRR